MCSHYYALYGRVEMNQKKMKVTVGISGIVSAVFFVLLIVLGVMYSGALLAKIVLFVISALVLLLAVELANIYILADNTTPNFFLYNQSTNRNISPKKLTFQIVNTKMNKFLSEYAASEGKLWTDKILDDPTLCIDDVFKPLVAYKLLFDLAERDFDIGWKCFGLASKRTVEYIAEGLDMNGDADFANKIRAIKAGEPVNLKHIRDLLVRNRKYLQNRMFKYTIDNINKF